MMTRTNEKISGAVAGAFLLLFAVVYCCVGAPKAQAADGFSSLSLKKLEAITAADVQPQMYLAPDYFAEKATTYPSNGDEYVLGQTPADQSQIGRGPHGGYDTTTSKCGVCHAAHSAQAGSVGLGDDNHLLRNGATGCEYCHLQGSIIGAVGASNKIVYTGGDARADSVLALDKSERSGHAITGNPVTVPASEGSPTITLTCATCHTVHGATSAWKPTDFWGEDGQYGNEETTDKFGYKLLRANPSGTAKGEVSTETTATDVNVVTDTRTVNQYTLSVWCRSCHDSPAMSREQTTAASPVLSVISTFTPAVDASAVHRPGSDSNLSTEETVAGPHDAVMNGVYSGPTQCYTCHRGALPAIPNRKIQVGESLLDRYVPVTNLGYYPPAADAKNPTDELTRNILCAACHYGTADYALLDAMGVGHSDWPHSSLGDKALLGDWYFSAADLTGVTAHTKVNTTPGLAIDKPSGYVCQRCHLAVDPADPVGNRLTISYHKRDHEFNWADMTGTLGELDGYYSPGYLAP